MKRLTILFIILIFSLSLSACFSRAESGAVIPDSGAKAGLGKSESTLPSSAEQSNLPAPTSQPQQSALPSAEPTPLATQPAPTAAETSPEERPQGAPGTIAESSVNLRMGPGFGYQVIKLLPKGLEVSIVGRSANGVWLETHLADGSGGWVFAGLLDMQASIASLPVSEASGGPLGEEPGPSSSRLDLLVLIVDNQARLTLNNFPAEQPFVVELGRAGEGADLVVARGVSGADGSAELSFEMPARWSDGERVVESELTLTASTADGSFSRSASVEYYRGQ